MSVIVKIFDLLIESLIVDSECGRRVNGDAVLNLANSLKLFEKKTSSGIERLAAHKLCRKNTHFPGVIDHIFGNLGVENRRTRKGQNSASGGC